MTNGYGGDGAAGTRTVPQLLALVIGVVYLLVGVIGFFYTGFDNFASPDDTERIFGIFEVNPLHNVVHLLVGAAGVALSRTLAQARQYGWLLAVAYGLVFLYGLFVGGEADANFLDLNGADDILHLLSALAGLAIALIPVDNTRSAGRV